MNILIEKDEDGNNVLDYSYNLDRRFRFDDANKYDNLLLMLIKNINKINDMFDKLEQSAKGQAIQDHTLIIELTERVARLEQKQ